MSVKKDKSGQVFGQWTVLKRHVGTMWKCRCTCGTIKSVSGTSLKLGKSKSCGCTQYDVHIKHGMEGTPTYNTWGHMLTRCRNPKHKQYAQYGGRGIKVCREWHSFESFFRDMGEKPEGLSLDRINNDDGYYKENCRWATLRQQVGNQQRSLRFEWNGKVQTLSDLAHEHNIPRQRVAQRLEAGWSLEKALTTPVKK